MVLHAFNRERPVADSHDFAVVRRAGGNCELGGKRLRVERERMVADDGEPLGEPLENTAAVRRDFRGFAVHHALCVNDLHDPHAAHAFVVCGAQRLEFICSGSRR